MRLIQVLLALAVCSLSALTLGEEVIRLQAAASPGTVEADVACYNALVDSLVRQIDRRTEADPAATQRFEAFVDLISPRIAAQTRSDILSFDLAKNRFDCSSLAILMFDVWQTNGDDLRFLLNHRHTRTTDGLYEFDPVVTTWRVRDACGDDGFVEGGVDLMLSAAERAMGAYYTESDYEEAECWFTCAQHHEPCDPSILGAWAYAALIIDERTLAEELLRRQLADQPQAAQCQFWLGRLLCQNNQCEEGLLRLRQALRMAEETGDVRLAQDARRALERWSAKND